MADSGRAISFYRRVLSSLDASFLDAGEIDEFIIHVIPTFIGEGIPLIAPAHRTVPLRLLSTHAYSDGVVRMHYAVEPEGKEKTKSRRTRKPKSK